MLLGLLHFTYCLWSQICDPPLFLCRGVLMNTSAIFSLDSLRLCVRHDVGLIISDRNNHTQVAPIAACILQWLHYTGWGMSVSRGTRYKVDMPVFRWYREVQCKRSLLDQILSYFDCDAPEVFHSSVGLKRLSHQFYWLTFFIVGGVGVHFNGTRVQVIVER